MLKPFPPIQAAIYHTSAEFQTFGFDTQTDPPKVLPDKVNIENTNHDEPNLCLAAAATINTCRLLRSGPINSDLRIQELNSLLRKLQPTSRRFSIFQLAFPEAELDAIRLQRYLLSKYPYEANGLSIPHLNYPCDLFFYLKKKKPLSAAFSSGSHKFSRLHNVEGWLTYSRWIFEEFTAQIQSIALTDTAKYTLEGDLIDFSHELRSSLLSSCRQQLEKLTLKAGDLEFGNKRPSEHPSNQQLMDEEKQALELLIELHTYLQLQIDLLDSIGATIEKMHTLHPELQSLQSIAQVFKELLSAQTDLSGTPKFSFGKQLMLAAVLNSLLGIATVITCDTGMERTSICFSISLAIMELLNTEKLADILRLVLEWDTSVLAVNLWITEQGNEKKNSPTEGDEAYEPTRLTTKLRFNVFKNLQIFTAPLLKEASEEGVVENKDINELGISQEYLNFLPDQYIEYDKKTGQPIAVKADAMAAIVAPFGI